MKKEGNAAFRLSGIVISALIVAGALIFSASSAESPAPFLRMSPDFGRIPLYFIPNGGQADGRALYLARASRYTLWVTRTGLLFDAVRTLKPKNENPRILRSEGSQGERLVTGLDFLGASPGLEVRAEGTTDYRLNTIAGDNPALWRTDIPTSPAVIYKEVYKDIDLKVYGRENEVEYDWIVRPGGNPDVIRFRYTEAAKISLDRDGNLVVATAFGDLIHKRPSGYQETESGRVEVESRFKRLGPDTFGFEVGAYDPGRPLIIDPLVLVWSTFLGGSSEDNPYDIAVDADGNVFVTGSTESSNFPAVLGFDKTYNGRYDVFVAKMNPSGTGLIWSTFIGGKDSDVGEALALDAEGAVYITGYTYSTNYPVKAAYDPTHNGYSDAFITKLGKSGGLVFSTFLGGNRWDDGSEIVVDPALGIFIAGATASPNFPVKNAYDGKFNGGEDDVFAARFLSNGKTLVFSTYIGGDKDEGASALCVDGFGRSYIAGYSDSANYPVTSAIDPVWNGGTDIIVSVLSLEGTTLLRSTFIGGSGEETAIHMVRDSLGFLYICGTTRSADFPVKNAYDTTFNGGDGDAYVLKLAPAAGALVYSTYLGGRGYDLARQLTVDSTGAVTVTGGTNSANFPKKLAFDAKINGGSDAFVSGLSPAGKALVFSSFIGGGREDFGRAVAIDSFGKLILAVRTESADFPVKAGYDSGPNGRMDAAIIKMFFK